MRVALYFTPAGVDKSQVAGKTAVVIDVLRATSVAAVALANGAKEIIPTATLGDATALRQKLSHDSCLLGGEREGTKVEGFDLGNSPFEYSRKVVTGKTIILASTNGSAALLLGGEADQSLACALVNLSAAAEKALSLGQDLILICAGLKGGFSLEDTLCGGMVFARLKELDAAVQPDNDAAWVAHELYQSHRDRLAQSIRQSEHGRYLEQLGFGEDLAFCAQQDSVPVVPRWQAGRMVLE